MGLIPHHAAKCGFPEPPENGTIRESVDSLCRDGADAQYMQKPYNFTTNTLIAYLST